MDSRVGIFPGHFAQSFFSAKMPSTTANGQTKLKVVKVQNSSGTEVNLLVQQLPYSMHMMSIYYDERKMKNILLVT